MCRISVTRFHRDRAVFDFLGDEVLPRQAGANGAHCAPIGPAVWQEGPAGLRQALRRRSAGTVRGLQHTSPGPGRESDMLTELHITPIVYRSGFARPIADELRAITASGLRPNREGGC